MCRTNKDKIMPGNKIYLFFQQIFMKCLAWKTDVVLGSEEK